MNDPVNQQLGNMAASLGELIAQVGEGVAQAQEALDRQALDTLRRIHGSDGGIADLREIGYQPTWYRIPEAKAEMVVALAMSSAPGPDHAGRSLLLAAPMDATYANRYGYDLRAASRISFRIVPVPPSAAAELARPVPQLVGLSWGEARAALEAVGLVGVAPAATAQAAIATSQAPAAGTLLQAGRSVDLGF